MLKMDEALFIAGIAQVTALFLIAFCLTVSIGDVRSDVAELKQELAECSTLKKKPE